MKITIELEGTGAEARQQLLDLLSGQITATIRREDLGVKINRTSPDEDPINTLENPEKISEGKNEVTKETRTRRTKAQIAAEEAKADDASGDNDQTNTLAQDNTQQNAPTFTMDQVKAKFVEIGRAGKRDHGLEVLKKFGADTVSKENPLAPEHYEAVIAELGKL